MPEYRRTQINGFPGLLIIDGNAWRLVKETTHAQWGHGSPGPPQGMSADEWRIEMNAAPFVTPELAPGEHYARMWRGGAWPPPEDTPFERAWREAKRVNGMLVAKLQSLFASIEPVAAHRRVYSHELRMLLILACNEVESSCKEILKAHDVRPNGKSFTMIDYQKLCRVMKLDRWSLRLSTNPDFGPIQPFGEWGTGPTLTWYQEHHTVKHGREEHLDNATLGNTISAVGGAFILARAQFGPWMESSAGFHPNEEFIIEAEPSWSNVETYVAPTVMGKRSPLFETCCTKRHPAL